MTPRLCALAMSAWLSMPQLAAADDVQCLAVLTAKRTACEATDAARAEVVRLQALADTAEAALKTARTTEAVGSPTLAAAQTAFDDANTAVGAASGASDLAEKNSPGQSCGQWAVQLEANKACGYLAGMLGSNGIDTPNSKVAAAIGAAATEPERVTAVNKSGSAAQIEPVETTRTINLAGGAISLAATGQGTQGVATVTVNPWAIAADATDLDAPRFTDVSVIVPFDLDSDATSDGARYVGLRARVNIAALTNLGPLQAAYDGYLQEQGKFEDMLTAILREAPNAQVCFDSVWNSGVVTKEACGATLDSKQVEESRRLAYGTIAEGRRAADRYYFGLDLRADIGNQKLISESTARGFGMLVGVAGGLRVDVSATWDLELRGRLGGDYFRSRDDGMDGSQVDPVFYFDGGGGFVLSGPVSSNIAKQRLGIGIGVEGRAASKASAEAEADSPKSFLDITAMLAVPTANGTDLSVGFRFPVANKSDRAVSITVAGDFGLFATSPQASGT